MTDAAEAAPPVQPKRGKKGLLFGVLGAVALGGAGFYGVYSGLLDPGKLPGLSGGDSKAAGHGGAGGPLGDIAFVAMDPITISLPPGSSARHLRFAGQLEVESEQAAAVAQLMPRILDVLNTYLRAVEVRDLEQPASIPRLRAQMLRRIQVVTGEGQVRDLLITEFILN
jgi:flagellar protein FliL